jgi:hypothetical protein
MVLINKIPPHTYVYEEEFSYKSLRKFLNFNMKKNWLQISWEVSNRIDRMELDLIVLFYNGNDSNALQS